MRSISCLLCAAFVLAGSAAWSASGGHGGGHGQGEGNGAAHAGMRAADAGKSVSDKLARDSRLSAGLAAKLPPGTDLQQAAAGFRNLGSFVAAVHVCSNLGISFSELKGKMMSGDSLGQAIHALKPGVDADAAARKARSQARVELAAAR
ncbi:hypothetical protein A203_09420 [Chromobacterium violaceum]|uniref:hypothetical protein n=1 Tax=Chromobacterium violaceum TaxID=536 RepID=UPI000B03D5A8|nr:hypothetical protein [Chromobacterium violaceum]MBA8734755.1 hypothetical protein [Chromobacterium violaceum]QIY80064.1 hypothetical protein FOB43_13120 [Chromobacterium violaceum]